MMRTSVISTGASCRKMMVMVCETVNKILHRSSYVNFLLTTKPDARFPYQLKTNGLKAIHPIFPLSRLCRLKRTGDDKKGGGELFVDAEVVSSILFC